MNHQEYVSEKTKYAYKLFKENRLFEKARSIVLKDGKMLAMHILSNGDYTYPGGGVDEGETVFEAAKREAFEESGSVVEPVEIIGKEFYDVKMNCLGEEFISKRVEYFVLCNFVERTKTESGIDGEYDVAGAEICWLNPNEIGNINNIKEPLKEEILKRIK